MAYVLIKATPEDSYFLLWDTGSDWPVNVYISREEALDYLEEAWRYHHPYLGNDGHWQIPSVAPADIPGFDAPRERLRRTEETGTSAMVGGHKWEDDELWVGVTDIPNGHYAAVTRDKMVQFCKHLYAGNVGAALELLIVKKHEDYDEDYDEDDGGEDSS